MAKFQVTNSYSATPGNCVGCGNTSGRKVVDTGVSVEFYGVIYFCEECAKDIGRTIGLLDIQIPPEQVIIISSKELENATSSVNDAIANMSHLISNFLDYMGQKSSDGVIDTETSFNEPDRTNEQINQSTIVERSSNVPVFSGNGPKFKLGLD